MKRKSQVIALISLVLTALVGSTAAHAGPSDQGESPGSGQARVSREWHHISSNVRGLLYQPVTAAPVTTALLAMHPEADFMEHFVCEGMARRNSDSPTRASMSFRARLSEDCGCPVISNGRRTFSATVRQGRSTGF